ncbi:hypothetical protein [Streptomyces sp. NPDC058622]|uniref:hypothetical protein n=1 Tax=Streptomyces sp. NPDC058622 TaxID=3346562 RepID=UPI0036462980
MSTIVGVHGISKQQLGPAQLENQWKPALQDGLIFASGREVGVPPLRMAFYGELFLNRTRSGASTKGAEPEQWLEHLDDDEEADLVSVASEVVTEQEIEEARERPGKAYTRVPLPLQAVLRALDRRFGPSAGVLYLGELRQVRRYLRDSRLKEEVDAVVRKAVSSECEVLIGHSLGSVVAFEFIRRHLDHPLALFLTLGSPLGLSMVRRLMPDPDYGSAKGLPSQVSAWVNVRDPRDPVACAGNLHEKWSGLTEVSSINNEGEAHSITRYLCKRETGAAVLTALPDLVA